MAGSDAEWAGTATESGQHVWITYFAGIEAVGIPIECTLPINVGDSASTVAGTLKNNFNVAAEGTPYSASLVGSQRNGVQFSGGVVDSMSIDGQTVGSGPATPIAGLTVQETASVN